VNIPQSFTVFSGVGETSIGKNNPIVLLKNEIKKNG
jgi:hypothetical protein